MRNDLPLIGFDVIVEKHWSHYNVRTKSMIKNGKSFRIVHLCYSCWRSAIVSLTGLISMLFGRIGLFNHNIMEKNIWLKKKEIAF